MGEEGVSGSYLVISEHKNDETKEINNSEIELLLQLKVESAEREIEELKKRRSEAAKANERVVGIFATHEQRWFFERKKLRLQINSLLNKLKIVEMKKDESISKLNEQLQSKDKKMKEVEEKLIKAEVIANELRETAKHEAKQHSSEIWKHKTAFFELVSTQRQLEAEMARAVRQVEASKQELVKMQKDLEQKDQILSAMLRKSKLDTTEKQMLVKEVKFSNNKSKRAEIETEKWSAVSELEAFHWRMTSMELESKRLHAHTEGLERELSLLKQDNMKLEALLVDQETELHSLKIQLKPPNMHLDSPMQDQAIMTHDSILSKVKVTKSESPGHKEKETRPVQEREETLIKNQPREIALKSQSPEKEFKEEEVSLKRYSSCVSVSMEETENAKKSELGSRCSSKKLNTLHKMDIHSLGVSYKIKRLKQQLVMFERLNQEFRCKDTEIDHSLVSLLNKQVTRYLSVNEKTDDLCKRMHENDLDIKRGDLGVERRKEESKKLERFLEETFQLQRYIVATGQKLREVQSKIAADCCGSISSFDMKRFGDGITNLFKDVQRGLEIRISRVIGDLEGTLACEGMMLHLHN